MQNSPNEPLLYESQRPYAQDDRLTWSPRASTTTTTTTTTTRTRRCHFNQQAATNQARGRRLFKACTNSNNDNLLRSRTGKLKAVARASHLIENFGRFISSRNNILSDNVISSGGYERHVEHRINDHPNRVNTVNKQPSSLSSENYSLRRCCIDDEKRNKTRRLLSALFNDKQRNKSSLLISLLRAPIVLAALFSLILVATLIVLYALSFQQHLSKQQQLPQDEYDNQLSLRLITKEVAQQQQQQLPQQGLMHHINGRDLDDLDDLLPSSPELDENSNINSGLARALTVQTECASYLGAPDGPGIVFRGIPFASPPIGKRRWKRPQPVWLDKQLCNVSRIVEARQWRSHCAQVSPVTLRFSGHEDCLYLDIYTPRLDQEKRLPVMVYIHGGFLAFGSSGQGGVNWLKGRPSAQLASELQVVMVAFNYRLQALGFMTMVELETSGAKADQNNNNSAPDESGQGNYGLWDQLVALNWIKRNIESFGGDPSNIVLFGPDSASSIPLALLATTTATATQTQTQTTTLSESPDDVAADADDDRGSRGEHSDVQSDHLQRANDTTSSRGRPVSSSLAAGSAKATRKTTKTKSEQANQPGIDRDLFRAAWLTDPAIYYELPYQTASLHYERLFLDEQSPCRAKAFNEELSNLDKAAFAVEANSPEKMELPQPSSASIPNHPESSSQWRHQRKLGDDGAQLNGSSSGMAATSPTTDGKTALYSGKQIVRSKTQQNSEQIVECLMNLSAEQVVRHYLGNDDPSYRLDDQNSLPIHGIFADQFVTVDGELVLRASYPFGGGGSHRKEFSDGLNEPKEEKLVRRRKGEVSKTKPAVLFNHNQPSEISDEPHYKQSSGNSKLALKQTVTTAAAATTSTVATTNASRPNYDDNCVGLICDRHNYRLIAPTVTRDGRRNHQQSRKVGGKDLLVGSSAQAVEFWPCPRDLDQWDWIDFKRYVATSLNSFLSETFANACQLYKLPLVASGGALVVEEEGYQTNASYSPTNTNTTTDVPNDGHRSNPMSPKETYLTMVSDIRQICPINELVANLRAGEKHRVHRYIVETRPSAQLAGMPQQKLHGNGDFRKLGGEQKLEFAYHTWDLFAFFGFHFDPKFKASEGDLKFQTQIRNLVKNFVHRKQSADHVLSNDYNRDSNDVTEDDDDSDNKQGEGYILFEKDGSISRQTNDAHRESECAMWRRHLDTSYAWIS